MRLQLQADTYGVEFNEHYLRSNGDGTVTVTVFGTADDRRAGDAGYDVGADIEGPDTWRERLADREAACARRSARTPPPRGDTAGTQLPPGRGRDPARGLLRELRRPLPVGRGQDTSGQRGAGRLDLRRPGAVGVVEPGRRHTGRRHAARDVDEHRRGHHAGHLHRAPRALRIGEAGTTQPAQPTRIRVGSSTGASKEGAVEEWLAGGLPPKAEGYLSDFTTRYMDPTEVYAGSTRSPTSSRPSQSSSRCRTGPTATSAAPRPRWPATTGSGSTPARADQAGAIVLTSRSWGHEGGNDITAEFRNPGAANAPLTVSVTGNDLVVSLGDGRDRRAEEHRRRRSLRRSTPTPPSGPARGERVHPREQRGPDPIVPGSGIVQPRAKVNLSDFLTTATNGHVPRGPFEYSAMRIGKQRDGSKVGVFLYCQQHAREWATPLTCLETAEQLLRNYAIDRRYAGSSTTSTSSSCRRRTRTARTSRCTTSASSGET